MAFSYSQNKTIFQWNTCNTCDLVLRISEIVVTINYYLNQILPESRCTTGFRLIDVPLVGLGVAIVGAEVLSSAM